MADRAFFIALSVHAEDDEHCDRLILDCVGEHYEAAKFAARMNRAFGRYDAVVDVALHIGAERREMTFADFEHEYGSLL